MKKIKNKKTLIILLVLCIGLVGITIAYFSNSTTIDNLFSTKEYGTTYTESFVSPDNWLPGDTTDKTIVVTNIGEVDQAVRIYITEEWKDSNSHNLSGWVHHADGTLSNHETEDELATDERAALINFDNEDDWTKVTEDGVDYYYYNYKIGPDEETSSLIKSVTFNPITSLGDTCTPITVDGKTTISCSSSGSDYDNAKYKLTFHIETVQYNKYKEAWEVDVAIESIKPMGCKSYNIGDLITYKGNEYYVLEESSETDQFLVLLKKEPLTAEEINKYSPNYVSQDGEYPYFESESCFANYVWYAGEEMPVTKGCIKDYNKSNIKEIVDNWSNDYNDDLVNVDGYNARLIKIDDLVNNMSYVSFYSSPYNEFMSSSDTPSWAYLNEKKYWSMSNVEDSNYIYGINEYSSKEEVYRKLYIRPVINLKKSSIDRGCNFDVKNKAYTIGDTITYENSNYCVISNSDIRKDYVTLIKIDPLSYEELLRYNNNYKIDYDGLISYYKSENCYYEDNSGITSGYEVNSGCNNNYNNSFIMDIVNNWSESFNNDLKTVDGYKARLITNEELNSMGHLLSYTYIDTSGILHPYAYISEYDCLYSDETYWTMSSSRDNSSTIDVVSKAPKGNGPKKIYNQYAVKPVINLKKCAITNTCE